MEEAKAKIGECFERLQSLDIKPTLPNMEILVQTLYDLRDVYNMMESEGKNDGGSAAGTE